MFAPLRSCSVAVLPACWPRERLKTAGGLACLWLLSGTPHRSGAGCTSATPQGRSLATAAAVWPWASTIRRPMRHPRTRLKRRRSPTLGCLAGRCAARQNMNDYLEGSYTTKQRQTLLLSWRRANFRGENRGYCESCNSCANREDFLRTASGSYTAILGADSGHGLFNEGF